jgi:protein O-mannosyl-transferase
MYNSNRSLTKASWAAIFTLLAVLTYVIYSQGFNAGWTFDDTRYLKHLGQVTDLDSAVAYLLKKKGISPTDRPISMASFLLNLHDWPDNHAGFRQINTLLHILNGLLVALIARMIAQLIPGLREKGNGFAVTLAAIWMLHPMLASTTFHIIQRMVLLAATFSLLGVIMYLRGRRQLLNGNSNGFVWMSAGMIVGAGIGTLAKETAAVTPLLVAVLEYTVLAKYAPISNRYLTRWRLLFFALPAAALFSYMVYYLNFQAANNYLIRPFTLEQRIFSEGVILFEYLRQLLVPDVTLMGPYQDDIWHVRGSEITTWLALTAWLVSLILAIAWRRRFPAFAFGVLFFLAGHLIESSVFSLELYFEHRNYLPSLGPIGAIVAVAWSSPERWPRYLTFGFSALMALLLWYTSALWGDQKESALTWNRKHSTSTRATQNLATYYQITGNLDAAASTIIKGYQLNPHSGALAIDAVISMCLDTPTTRKYQSIPAQVAADAPKLDYSASAIQNLHTQISLFAQGRCKQFNADQSIAIAKGLLTNPAFQHPMEQYGLLMAVARAMETQGKIGEAIKTKIRAFRVIPAINAAQTIFFQLVQTGKMDAARAFLQEARGRAPQYADLYDSWEMQLKK